MTNLSPFHQEIVGFLQNRVDLRSSERTDRELDLARLVEHYQRSFDHIEDPRIEAAWMSSFTEAEFTRLGLKSYFPKIYRGLPRLYARDNPSLSRIKKNFTDLGRLKNLTIEPALFSLYNGFVPKVGTKVGILTWVMSDGLGDWMAAQEAARILVSRFPMIDIHLIAVTQKETLQAGDFQTHLIRYTKNLTIDLPIEMDFILQIPTYLLDSENLFPGVAMESVGEYGFLESSWFHPKSNHRSMGLHALEKGIFIRKHQKVSFIEIEKKSLLQTLFGTQMPGPVEVDAYQQRVRFHLAYLATINGGAIYLHSLLKMWERDEKDIDVCSPDLSWAIQWFEQRQKDQLPLLQESFGVKEIVVEWEGQTHRVQLAQKGKVLRIIAPGVISFADMQRLINLSGDWVGVRGNQSLSEAISSGKAFFYDGREHSRYLVKDLIAMAENRLSGYRGALHAFRMMGQAFLWNLPEDLEPWVDDTHFQQEEKKGWFEIATELGACLQDSDAIAGFKKFGLICSEEHSIAPFLCHLVQRGLFHLAHPVMRTKEAELRKLYGEGSISFSNLVTQLRNKYGSSSTQSSFIS